MYGVQKFVKSCYDKDKDLSTNTTVLGLI